MPDKKQEVKGLICPGCGCRHFYTIDSRPVTENKVRRRRVCRNCGREVRTLEIIVESY